MELTDENIRNGIEFILSTSRQMNQFINNPIQISTNSISTDDPLVSRGNSNIEINQTNDSEISDNVLYYISVSKASDSLLSEEGAFYVAQSIRDYYGKKYSDIFRFINNALGTNHSSYKIVNKIIFEDESTIEIDDLLDKLVEFYKENETVFEDAFLKNVEKNQENLKQVQELIQSNRILLNGTVYNTELTINQENISKLRPSTEENNDIPPTTVPITTDTNAIQVVKNNKFSIVKILTFIVIILCILLLTFIIFTYVYRPIINSETNKNT